MEPTVVPELVRRATMGLLMLVHIQLAAFLIGIFVLGVTMEFFGFLNRGQPRFDRLARGLGKTAIIMYSTGAVLAIIFILIISIFWPIFWYIVFRINFWPMVLEGVTFVLTILFLFPWYFTWDSLARFKGVHLAMGAALIMAVEYQQAMIDVMASYMLTPTTPSDFLRVFFNPTTVPLDAHRLVGDISFAGFVVAGYAAFRTLRARTDEDRAYFDWVGSIALMAGLIFMFLQPAIGIAYLEEIRASAPGGFTTMMRGRLSWLFLVQVVFLSALFLLSLLYMFWQVRKGRGRHYRLLRWTLIVSGLSALLLVQPYMIGPSQDHPWINWVNPIGTMQPWKYIAMAGLTLSALAAFYGYLAAHRRWIPWGVLGRGGRSAQYSLVATAILGSAMMLLMGYIRENGRAPYLIYYDLRIDQPERFPQLAPAPTPKPASGIAPAAPGGGAQGEADTPSEAGP